VIGGRVNTVGRNARLGTGDFIVLEADESDGSFLMLSPTIAVITNVEADHLDHYSGIDEIEDAFVAFANKVPFYGAVVVPSETMAAPRIARRIKRTVITFGTAPDARVRIERCVFDGLGSRFELHYNGGSQVACRLQVPGDHNVLNAAAAFAAAYEMGVEPEVIAAGLAAFAGVERRFQIKVSDPFTVIDDYAHHPTEIRATIAAARRAGFKRILAAFQPHRYTRTHHLLDDFVSAFDEADSVMIADIYPAGEMPIDGVTSRALVERIRLAGKTPVEHVAQVEGMEARFLDRARAGDLVLIMGAGNITALADRVAAAAGRIGHGKVNHG
jgi:UDP-N-acetylmuramate--alanine ligase